MRYSEIERRLAALERIEVEQPDHAALSWGEWWLQAHPWVEGRDEEQFVAVLLDNYRGVLDPWYHHNRYYGPNAVPRPSQDRGWWEGAQAWHNLTWSAHDPALAEEQIEIVQEWRDAMLADGHPDAAEFAAFVVWAEDIVSNRLERYMGDGKNQWTPGGRPPAWE